MPRRPGTRQPGLYPVHLAPWVRRWVAIRVAKPIDGTWAKVRYTVRITGTIKPGQGDASKNYERMIAAAAVYCPAVANCGLHGTINVHLDQPLDKGHADCWTPRIPWKPVFWNGKEWDQKIDREEEFGFIEIKFEHSLDGQLYDAWIVLPSGHGATYYDRFLVEIIAAELIGGCRLEYHTRCAIHLDHVPSIARPSSFDAPSAGLREGWLGVI